MAINNIVLVHGAFADGSGWQGVYDVLTADGYRVAVVQNSTLSLAGDVAATHQVLGGLGGPAVLVGHSYGGAVITEAGNHPNVAALAYIAAFVPDEGESVGTLIADPPPDAPTPPILPPQDGFLFLDRDGFAAAFAGNVPEKLAAFMADSQVGLGVDALNGAISEPAWRTKPSWYLVTTEDWIVGRELALIREQNHRPPTRTPALPEKGRPARNAQFAGRLDASSGLTRGAELAAIRCAIRTAH